MPSHVILERRVAGRTNPVQPGIDRLQDQDQKLQFVSSNINEVLIGDDTADRHYFNYAKHRRLSGLTHRVICVTAVGKTAFVYISLSTSRMRKTDFSSVRYLICDHIFVITNTPILKSVQRDADDVG